MKDAKEFPSAVNGERGPLHFRAVIPLTNRTSRECSTCGGDVKRSWRTGILHRDCYGCRYLKMIYGPNIKVRRLDS